MAKKKKLNKNWLHDHINDPYVKMATNAGYRARAAFKLKEIAEPEGLLKPGIKVVDLGSAPGSWSQVLREALVGPGGVINGRIIALDLLPMEPIAGVEFIQGDFRDEAVLEDLNQRLGGEKLDLVVSDMAPNLSGIGSADERMSATSTAAHSPSSVEISNRRAVACTWLRRSDRNWKARVSRRPACRSSSSPAGRPAGT